MKLKLTRWKNRGRFYEIHLNLYDIDKNIAFAFKFEKPKLLKEVEAERCKLYLSLLVDKQRVKQPYYFFIDNYLMKVNPSLSEQNWLEFSLNIDLIFKRFYKETLRLYKVSVGLTKQEKEMIDKNLEDIYLSSIKRIKEKYFKLKEGIYDYVLALNLNSGEMAFSQLDFSKEVKDFSFIKFLKKEYKDLNYLLLLYNYVSAILPEEIFE